MSTSRSSSSELSSSSPGDSSSSGDRVDLNDRLKVKDLNECRDVYNSLPHRGHEPAVSSRSLEELAMIFVRHNAHNHFGIHLASRKFDLPNDTVAIGTRFSEERERWIGAATMASIDPSDVHGRIYQLGHLSQQAYELELGPMPDLSSVGEGFMDELDAYISTRQLWDVYGLLVLTPARPAGRADDPSLTASSLDYVQETLALDSCLARNVPLVGRARCWTFESVNGRPRVCQPEEHVKKVTGIGERSDLDDGFRAMAVKDAAKEGPDDDEAMEGAVASAAHEKTIDDEAREPSPGGTSSLSRKIDAAMGKWTLNGLGGKRGGT